LRRREGDSVAALAGFEGECDRQVSLAGARRTEEADVGVLLDPGQLGQVQHERALGVGLRRPVEVLECLQRGEAGVADAHPGAGGVAGEDLRLEQGLQEALVRPLLLAGERRCLLEPLKHAWRFQLAEQVGQPLSDLRLAHAQSAA
jgi:hypothetical protein